MHAPARRQPASREVPWEVYGAGFFALALTVLVVMHPKEALEASVFGLRLWFDVVLPALFPFFTLAEILMGLGVIHFAGVLLEPAMRPLFRIPGIGGFVVAIGLASGYPLGAKMTGQIQRQGLLTGLEGERLVSFANTADPLFIVGAVAVGMFGMPEIGGAMVAAHYLAVFGVGLLMRFHGGGRMGPAKPQTYGDGMFARALRAMREAREKDARPIGELLGGAVRSALQSMLFVGGCIMIFSVFLQVLTVSGVVEAAGLALSHVLVPLGLHPDLVHALLKGAVEITIGTQASSEAAAPLTQKVMVASAIIAWSGLGVHAQVAAMLYGTPIRLGPYVWARFLHAVLAAAITWLLLEPARGVLDHWIVPVFAPLSQAGIQGFWFRLASSLTWAGYTCGGLLLAALLLALQTKVMGPRASRSSRRRP